MPLNFFRYILIFLARIIDLIRWSKVQLCTWWKNSRERIIKKFNRKHINEENWVANSSLMKERYRQWSLMMQSEGSRIKSQRDEGRRVSPMARRAPVVRRDPMVKRTLIMRWASKETEQQMELGEGMVAIAIFNDGRGLIIGETTTRRTLQ